MIDDQDIVKRILEISSLHLPQLESNQAIDDYIKIIQEKLKIEWTAMKAAEAIWASAAFPCQLTPVRL